MAGHGDADGGKGNGKSRRPWVYRNEHIGAGGGLPRGVGAVRAPPRRTDPSQWPPLVPGLQGAGGGHPGGPVPRHGTQGRWRCDTCGCRKNEARFFYCKHCGSLRDASSAGWSPQRSLALFQDAGAAPAVHGAGGGNGALGGGKGGAGGKGPQDGLDAGPPQQAPLSVEEYTQMANLCDKMGDAAGAASYRRAAAALRKPADVPEALHVRLNKAHQRSKAVERRLEAACAKFDQLESQLDTARHNVAQLRSELVQSEAEHRELVKKLNSEMPDAASRAAPKLALDDLLDESRFSSVFDLELGETFTVSAEEGLSPEDEAALVARVDEFKTGITNLAKSMFAEAKSKVEALRVEHKALATRMAVKKRRTDEEGSAAAGGKDPKAAAPVVTGTKDGETLRGFYTGCFWVGSNFFGGNRC